MGFISHSFALLYSPTENKEHHSESSLSSQSPSCLMCCDLIIFFLVERDIMVVWEPSLNVCEPI